MKKKTEREENSPFIVDKKREKFSIIKLNFTHSIAQFLFFSPFFLNHFKFHDKKINKLDIHWMRRYSTVILPQLVNHPTDALAMDFDMASWVGKLLFLFFLLQFFFITLPYNKI